MHRFPQTEEELKFAKKLFYHQHGRCFVLKDEEELRKYTEWAVGKRVDSDGWEITMEGDLIKGHNLQTKTPDFLIIQGQ